MATTEQMIRPGIHHDSFTVMIVDDDEHFRNAYVRAINLIRVSTVDASLHAISAATPSQAMEILEENHVDCCILDYRMPEENGLALQREILTKHPDMAIIFVTGSGNEQVAAEAIKQGAMDYIVKGTISIEQIESAIVHSVSRVRLARALEMQRKQLLESEGQRAMITGLGAACHKIAPPLTLLRKNIVALKRSETDPAREAMLVEAFEAVETICEVVWKIGRVTVSENGSETKTGTCSGSATRSDISEPGKAQLENQGDDNENHAGRR